MGAEVTGKLSLDVSQFRTAIASAQTGWEKLEGKMGTGSKRLATAMAPAAKTVAAVAAAFTAVGVAGTVALGGVMRTGLAMNSQMEQASITFKAFTKDATLASQIVADLKKEADITPFDTGDMVQAGKALISSAKGSREELMKLIKTAEILAALNPEQGLAGAAFSLREAEGGDYQSLIERFNISRGLVKQLKAEGKEGNELVLAALKNMGAGPELVAGLAGSFTGLQSTAAAFFDQIQADIAEPTFQVMKEGMQEFASALSGEEGKNISEWSKALGKDLGEAAKAIKESLSNIDWAAVLEGAGKFARLIGAAAEKAAAASNWLSHNGDAIDQAAQETANAIANPAMRGFAAFNEAGSVVYDALGMDESAKKTRDYANNLRSKAYAREASLKARQNAVVDSGLAAAGPLGQKDVIQNWLQAHGKTAEDLGTDSALQGEVARRFGRTEEGLEGIRSIAGDHVWDKAKTYMAPGGLNDQRMKSSLQGNRPGYEPGPINITLTETDQKHSVMATTGV